MDKEIRVNIYNRVLFNHEEVWNYVTCKKMGGTGDHHVK
jgi:hypothetical protein